MSILSIIIPFGTSEKRDFINQRVINKIEELKDVDNIEVVFVEGFSSKPDPTLKDAILSNGFKYIKDETQQIFSVGGCRNLGVMHSSSPVFTFLDVDYYISKDTLKKLINLIQVKEIDKNPNRFLFLPCAFLSEHGTNTLLENRKELWDTMVQYDIISSKKNITKFFAISSSSVVMNRHKFLELGGNDRSYEGHGYEDFDFYMRLMKSCSRVETMPEMLEYDARSWNFIDYKGFRALFSIPGFETAMYGIYLYHFWHPEPNNDGYLDKREYNHQKFYSKMKNYKIMSDGPDPLLSSECLNDKCLVFCPENSKVYRSLRGVNPYLGNFICKKEVDFFNNDKFNADYFVNYLAQNKITRVLFPNPYGNKNRIEIYNYVRENNISYICYDRGALPDSWFFDNKGFNYDSESYNEEKWDKPLSPDEDARVEYYINNLKKADSFLEAQGASIGAIELRKKLGIRNKKVVFIPLQVEDDTVIKYYSSEGFSYYEFADTVNSIAGELYKEDWVFVAKRHPLMQSFDKSKYGNVIFVSDDTNLIDLIEMSDCVLTINSGVGVYAMIYKKPCIITGNAFYHFDGINIKCTSKNEIIDYIINNIKHVDFEKVKRFIHFLCYNFYSFGKSYYSSVQEGERVRRIVNYIDFYRINISGRKIYDGDDSRLFVYKRDTLAMRPYSSDIRRIENKLKEKNKETTIVKEVASRKNSTTSSPNKILSKPNSKSTSSLNKKISKLLRDPKLFFIDMLKKHF